MHQSPRRHPRRPLLRAALSAAGLAALLATPAAAQGNGRIFDGSLLPSFAHLRTVLSKHLLIPVQGVGPESLRDSYLEGRSGGRTHHAIDIHAPHNTPVLAAADGTILKLQHNGLGGTTIYHLDDDGHTRYYYAHLDHYAEGLAEGQRVQKGDVIGYVGDTGNAAPGDYHLHFAVAFLGNLHRWWDGETVNPFYLLRDGTARIDGHGGEVAGDDRGSAPARLASVAVERPRRDRAESRNLSAGERAAVATRLEREERAARHRCAGGEEGRARRHCLEAVQNRFNTARALLAKHVDPRVCTAATAPASSSHARHSSSSRSKAHGSGAPTAGPCSPRSESTASTRHARGSSEKAESSVHHSRTHDSQSGGGSHRPASSKKHGASSSHRESSAASHRSSAHSSSRTGRTEVPRGHGTSTHSPKSSRAASSASHRARSSTSTTRHHKKSE
jgi:murein DD-endopeptidase MepM/ murein hydrolase activator NlpD